MNEINLPTDYQSFIHISRYARWIEDFNRRETWNETVDRYFDYMETHLSKKYNYKLGDFPMAEQLSSTTISLPVHEYVVEEEIYNVSKLIQEFFK